MYCPQCGSLNEATAHFCKNCGAALTVNELAEKSDILYTPPPESQNVFTTLLFWAALAVILGFFLPWVSFAGLVSINGWNISSGLMQIGGLTSKANDDTLLYSIMLYLMPIASAAVLIGLFSNAGKTFLKIAKWIPLIIVLAFIIIIIVNMDGQLTGEAFRYFSIGFYLTIIGAFLLAFAPIRK